MFLYISIYFYLFLYVSICFYGLNWYSLSVSMVSTDIFKQYFKYIFTWKQKRTRYNSQVLKDHTLGSGVEYFHAGSENSYQKRRLFLRHSYVGMRWHPSKPLITTWLLPCTMMNFGSWLVMTNNQQHWYIHTLHGYHHSCVYPFDPQLVIVVYVMVDHGLLVG